MLRRAFIATFFVATLLVLVFSIHFLLSTKQHSRVSSVIPVESQKQITIAQNEPTSIMRGSQQDARTTIVAATPTPAEKLTKTRIQEIKDYLLNEEPNTWSYYSELLRMYRQGEGRMEVFELLEEVISQNPGASAPHEALGQLYAIDEKWELAIPHLESIIDYTDRPFSNRITLITAQYETGDADASIARAQELKAMIRDYASKKRDVSLVKESLNDGHLWQACLLEGLAYAKKGELAKGKKSIRLCGKDIIKDEKKVEEEFGALANALDDLQGKTFKDVIEDLD